MEICPYRTLVNEVVGAPRAVLGFQSNPISSQKRGTIMTTAAYDEIASSSEFCITHPRFYSPDSDTVTEPDGTPVRRVRRYFDEGFLV